MKNLHLIVYLTLCSLIAATSLASADSDKSVRILVAKGNDTTAKVTIGTQTYLAPIRFEDGNLTWNNVKDGYYITPGFASLFEQGRVVIYVEGSTTQFRALRAPAKTAK